MTKKLTIFWALLLLTLMSCNQGQNTTTEKENELLKKENELLKKEQDLNAKDKSQKTENQTASPQSSNSIDDWKTFNHRYGFTIQLPRGFSEGAITASGIQYFKNDFDDNIILGVETYGEGSRTSLVNDYQSRINSTVGIDYKTLKDNWFVISGQDDKEIYYYKMVVKNNRSYFLMLTYPFKQKDLFDNVLARISRSFQ